MASHPLFRRRRFLVDNKIQLRFIFLLFVQMAVIVGLFAYFSHLHIERTKNIALQDPNLSAATAAKLHEHAASFYTWMFVLCFVVAIALIICGILASHKIAGPVLKLKRFLKAVAEGDFSQQIAFRRKDQLDDFASILNETVVSLATRKTKRQQILSELSQRADALSESVSAEAPRVQDAQRLIGEIQTFFNELKDVI